MTISSKLSLRIANIFTKLMMVSLVMAVLQPAQAETGTFDCAAATSGKTGEKRQTAAELLNHSYDTSRLACGAQVLTTFADKNTGDYNAQITALQANARYMYYLDRIVVYELGYLISWYVTEVPEETKLNGPMIALIAAQQEQQRILQQARDAGFDTAELNYFESLGIGPVAKNLPRLKDLVSEDPPGLKGGAHALLAETYYALPDIAGGDLDLAIVMMRAATERAPDNPRYARLLAGYLLDNGEREQALSVLNQLLSLQPGMSGWQLQADQLRVAADMAERIGEDSLARQLSDQRDAMLQHTPICKPGPWSQRWGILVTRTRWQNRTLNDQIGGTLG